MIFTDMKNEVRITKLIELYPEKNFFISKTIYEKIQNNKKLIQLSRELYQKPNLGNLSMYDFFNLKYEPVKPGEIPNFLTKDWAIGENNE